MRGCNFFALSQEVEIILTLMKSSIMQMMWAADFDESVVCNLEENCLDALLLNVPRDCEGDTREESIENSDGSSRDGSQSKHGNVEHPTSDNTGMKSASAYNFCGFTKNFWSRNDCMQITNAISSTKNGDDELPVFCVAAILIMNRQKIIKETRSIDDMIKAGVWFCSSITLSSYN